MVWSQSKLPPARKKRDCHCDGNARYVRAVRRPDERGLSQYDYDSHHKARGWPTGTEYNHAYNSNYDPPTNNIRVHQQKQQERSECLEQHFQQHCNQQQRVRQNDCMRLCEQGDPYNQFGKPVEQRQTDNDDLQRMTQSCVKQQQCPQYGVDQGSYQGTPSAQWTKAPRQDFRLYEPTPEPYNDKHYRGAHYRPGEQIGVQVPEETNRYRDVVEGGKTQLGWQEHMDNLYLPLYRYKDWVERPEYEVYRDCNDRSLLCPLPEAPTQYWDFYNEVRMKRPKKELQTQRSTYAKCRVVPIPRDKEIDSFTSIPYDPLCAQYGKFKNYKFEEVAFQPNNLCKC